jgi:hypothetical protein
MEASEAKRRFSFALQLHSIVSAFKKMNKILLVIGLGVFVYHCINYGLKGLVFFLGLYAFAWIEYINYYVIRLSYQSPSEIKEFFEQKGFKRSILAREIDKNQRV